MTASYRPRRRSSGAAGAPSASSVGWGEMLVNEMDTGGGLYYGKGGTLSACSSVIALAGPNATWITSSQITTALGYTPTSTAAAAAAAPVQSVVGQTGTITAAQISTALGLGTAATANIGTASGTVAAGNDSRITGAEQTSNKGIANGYAPLDSSGHVPLANLPSSVTGALNYQGTWNASTNSPSLSSSTGTAGYYYVVATAGTTTLNGLNQWNVGDWAVYNGSTWEKLDGVASEVLSVVGQTGTVTAAQISTALSLGTLATQNAASVAITGGTISGVSLSATSITASGTITASGGFIDGSATVNTPVNGFSLTLSNSVFNLILTPAGTLASGTITMSASPANGQMVSIQSTQPITAITFTPNSGQTISGAPSTMAAFIEYNFIYLSASTKWICQTGATASTASLGTIASQSANAVAITGGTVDNVTIGGTTPAAGNFTNLSMTGNFSGTIDGGTW